MSWSSFRFLFCCRRQKKRSKGERLVLQALKKHQPYIFGRYTIKEQYHVKFVISGSPIRAFYDFFIPELKLLIEFDGQQHFKQSKLFDKPLVDQRKADEAKNTYAENNRLHLLRIPYTKINNIEKIIEQILKYVRKNRGKSKALLKPPLDYFELKK